MNGFIKKTFSKVGLLLAISLLSLSTLYAQKSDLLFPEAPGIVSFTYRASFAKDVPATLDIVKGNGITDIEFSNLFNQTPENLRKFIDEKGIKCSSYGVSYDDLVNKTAEVAVAAKTLGAQYVRVAGIPHKGVFTLDNAKQAVEDFNKYGKILKDQYGLTFIYHNHGFEFQPYEDGTLYDYIAKNTNPKYVSFELDILWAFFPGQDPAKMLNKYGKRYKALHMKDLRKGIAGNMTGGTSQENDVILGTGQIDIPAVIKAARKAGVKHFYIEDESSSSIAQVPESIKYLNSLKK
jgi:sugar phosphate isomerase/epimerase